METQKLKNQLLAIANIVQGIINELPDNGAKLAQVDVDRDACPVCKLPFTEKDPMGQRGVHNRCYKRIQREDKLELAELSGVLLPKHKAGRKKSIDLDEIIDAPKNLKKKATRNPKKQ